MGNHSTAYMDLILHALDLSVTDLPILPVLLGDSRFFVTYPDLPTKA